MAEGSGGQRYCGNCGAELRPGMTFCTSCGAPVSSGAGGPGPSSSGPDGPRRLGSLVGDLRRSFRRSADGLRGTFSGSADGLRDTFSGVGTDGIRRIPRRISGWFKDLPGAPKLVIVGVVALVLLVLLSPVAVALAGVLLLVSVIALAIRIYQKGPIRNWGMVAVASVVLMFAFGGISGALYGGGDETSSGQTGGDESDTATPSPGGGEASPAASPEDSPAASPDASPDASPAALSVGDEVDLTCEIHGYSESFDYDGLGVVGQVLDCDGVRIMAVSDWARGGDLLMGMPGEQVRVSGEYEGPISTSVGGSYEAVMVEEIETVAQ